MLRLTTLRSIRFASSVSVRPFALQGACRGGQRSDGRTPQVSSLNRGLDIFTQLDFVFQDLSQDECRQSSQQRWPRRNREAASLNRVDAIRDRPGESRAQGRIDHLDDRHASHKENAELTETRDIRPAEGDPTTQWTARDRGGARVQRSGQPADPRASRPEPALPLDSQAKLYVRRLREGEAIGERYRPR